MHLADPATSRAILIGAAHYDDPALADIVQAQANVEDLAAILTDPTLGGFRPDNVRTMVDPRHREDASVEIARWCAAAEDVLVVYYTGHGLVDENGELLLATSDTIEAEKEHHSLRVEMVRRAVRRSPAKVKIAIFDCCYSGRAFGQVMADEASQVLDQTETAGMCGLASAPRHLASLFVEGERHTVFSGELIKVLRDGVRDEGPMLSVFATYQQLRRRMRDRSHPEPKIMHSDAVSAFALVRNRAYAPPVTAPPIAPPPPVHVAAPQRLRTLAEADAVATGRPDVLALAATEPAWPVFARLRFVSELVRAGEIHPAHRALQKFGLIATIRPIEAIRSLLEELADDRAWTDESWHTSDLVQDGRPLTDVQARLLWGVAMARLLEAATLPTPLRVRALEELVELGHRDEAALIARGILRGKGVDAALADQVTAFLARAGAGTPDWTGGDPALRRQSGEGWPRL